MVVEGRRVGARTGVPSMGRGALDVPAGGLVGLQGQVTVDDCSGL